MLASFPLATARDRHVMLPGVTRHISKFLHEATQNGAVDLPYTPVVSIAYR